MLATRIRNISSNPLAEAIIRLLPEWCPLILVHNSTEIDPFAIDVHVKSSDIPAAAWAEIERHMERELLLDRRGQASRDSIVLGEVEKARSGLISKMMQNPDSRAWLS